MCVFVHITHTTQHTTYERERERESERKREREKERKLSYFRALANDAGMAPGSK